MQLNAIRTPAINMDRIGFSLTGDGLGSVGRDASGVHRNLVATGSRISDASGSDLFPTQEAAEAVAMLASQGDAPALAVVQVMQKHHQPNDKTAVFPFTVEGLQQQSLKGDGGHGVHLSDGGTADGGLTASDVSFRELKQDRILLPDDWQAQPNTRAVVDGDVIVRNEAPNRAL